MGEMRVMALGMEVLDTAAVANTAIRAEGEDQTPDEVEQFRRFLDTASPEDFDPD